MRKANPGLPTRSVMEMGSKATNCAMPPRRLLSWEHGTSPSSSIKRSLNGLCRKSFSAWKSLLQPLLSFPCTLSPGARGRMSKSLSMVRDPMSYLADTDGIWEFFMVIGGAAFRQACVRCLDTLLIDYLE